MAKTVLIPAAGAGSRFAQAGITTPKPLNTVDGRTLLEHTLASFHWSSGDELILAVQQRSQQLQESAQELRDYLASLEGLSANGPTAFARGPSSIGSIDSFERTDALSDFSAVEARS